jgi:hypothetical protein
MTKPISASKRGLKPHFKVRIVLPGALLHLASWDVPRITRGMLSSGIDNVSADWIDDPDYGDTRGYIDWPRVDAITWRRSK